MAAAPAQAASLHVTFPQSAEVTVVQGQSSGFTLEVQALGAVPCSATTAPVRVDSLYSVDAVGDVASGLPGDMPIKTAENRGSSDNCYIQTPVLVPLTATAAADTPVGDYTGVIRYGQGGDGGVDLDGPPVIIHVVAPDAVDAPAATLPASPLVSTEQLVLGVRQPKPRPKFGQTQLISRVKGKVTFRTPGGPARSLGDPMIVPNGTVVDASDGVVKVAVERAKGGTLDSADAWGGSFHMSQSAGGVTTFKLTGAVTSSRSASASKVSAKRSLWVNGKGNFKTRGKRASAIVRGTYWFTQETTAGTKVQVKRGLVAVRDFVRKRTTLVGAGHSYVARPRATVVRRVPAFAGENARR